jgi:hypothetical protein
LRAHGRGANALDYELLAEEVEDRGRSQRRACESLTEQILIHFIKIAFIGTPRDLNHWEGEIFVFRDQLIREMSPSLRDPLAADVPVLWRRVRGSLTRKWRDWSEAPDLPETCPYSFDDILCRGTDWLPEPAPQA